MSDFHLSVVFMTKTFHSVSRQVDHILISITINNFIVHVGIILIRNNMGYVFFS